MAMFRHVVVGLDVSARTDGLTPGCRVALDHTLWLARSATLRCTLVHSGFEDEYWDPQTGEYGVREPVVAGVLEDTQQELQAAGVETDLKRSVERPALAIIREVIEGPCDLVLVGKRSEADPGGPTLGSTTTKLLRKCPCAVWAVAPGSAPPPTRILAATDLSEVGRKVLERAADFTRQAQAELHVVHTVQLTMEAQLGTEESTDAYLRRMREETLATLEQDLAGFGVEGAKLHVGLGSPSAAVLECASRFETDLVVMGTVSRSGISGLLLGNTAERLLPRLGASLLTLKPADFVCPVRLD